MHLINDIFGKSENKVLEVLEDGDETVYRISIVPAPLSEIRLLINARYFLCIDCQGSERVEELRTAPSQFYQFLSPDSLLHSKGN